LGGVLQLGVGSQFIGCVPEALFKVRVIRWHSFEIDLDCGLRDNDQAFSWLEKAYVERSDFLLVLKVDPLFEGLHDDPRFGGLVRRIGFPS
jgi:hypothetical protein